MMDIPPRADTRVASYHQESASDATLSLSQTQTHPMTINLCRLLAEITEFALWV